MELRAILALTLIVSLCAPGGHSRELTIKNNCPFKVWPVILSPQVVPQIPTGFDLASKGTVSFQTPYGWLGGIIWGRTKCSISSTTFKCETGDCGTAKLTCNNTNAIPPASLVNLGLLGSKQGKDDYYIDLSQGFNLPVSLTPKGGSGNCSEASCPSNVNSVCPKQLAVKGSDGSVVLCKSACVEFKTPESCCTLAYDAPNKCMPSEYTKIIGQKCPLAHSYNYEPKGKFFSCSGEPNYVITFCP
ncbi:unnamed protein product [Lupinus luteus]|uniref:Thaumatin-like protein n=1 Tax=Lupinus luteus TaxID=3873 RepID=A0AAV1X967_LUPLU